jgi:glycosyltransferase involved in cell wall biosynthesis
MAPAAGDGAGMTVTPVAARRRTGVRRVALYYPWIYLTSGAERTILELTAWSRHTWTLFTNHFEPETTFPGFGDRQVVRLREVAVRRSMGAVTAAAWRIASQQLPITGYDALVVMCEGVGDLVLFRSAIRPSYCICLTPLRAAFDPEYRRRAEEQRGPFARVVLRAGLSAFRLADRRAWRSYTRIFCISEEVKRRALKGRLAPASALEVLHPGIGIRGLAPSDVFHPFFLVPGRLMWTKNVELAIAAFEEFRTRSAEGREFRLVIAGAVDRKSEPYLAALRARAAGLHGVEFRIAPSDAELRELYRTCYAVLFPSFNEDWGIVPIEGMSFGKPVVATDRGGPREIVRPEVEGFLEEPEPMAFAGRMVDLAHSPSLARAMGRAAFTRSRAFSWDTFAARIDQAIEEGTS